MKLSMFVLLWISFWTVAAGFTLTVKRLIDFPTADVTIRIHGEIDCSLDLKFMVWKEKKPSEYVSWVEFHYDDKEEAIHPCVTQETALEFLNLRNSTCSCMNFTYQANLFLKMKVNSDSFHPWKVRAISTGFSVPDHTFVLDSLPPLVNETLLPIAKLISIAHNFLEIHCFFPEQILPENVDRNKGWTPIQFYVHNVHSGERRKDAVFVGELLGRNKLHTPFCTRDSFQIRDKDNKTSDDESLPSMCVETHFPSETFAKLFYPVDKIKTGTRVSCSFNQRVSARADMYGSLQEMACAQNNLQYIDLKPVYKPVGGSNNIKIFCTSEYVFPSDSICSPRNTFVSISSEDERLERDVSRSVYIDTNVLLTGKSFHISCYTTDYSGNPVFHKRYKSNQVRTDVIQTICSYNLTNTYYARIIPLNSNKYRCVVSKLIHFCPQVHKVEMGDQGCFYTCPSIDNGHDVFFDVEFQPALNISTVECRLSTEISGRSHTFSVSDKKNCALIPDPVFRYSLFSNTFFKILFFRRHLCRPDEDNVTQMKFEIKIYQKQDFGDEHLLLSYITQKDSPHSVMIKDKSRLASKEIWISTDYLLELSKDRHYQLYGEVSFLSPTYGIYTDIIPFEWFNQHSKWRLNQYSRGIKVKSCKWMCWITCFFVHLWTLFQVK